MKHLLRAAGLVAIVIFIALVLPRLVKVPAFMTNFGFHISQKSVNAAAWASRPAQFAETSACQSCHPDEYDAWQQGAHKTVSCENCHGPAEAHLQNQSPLVIDATQQLCVNCHGYLPSRPKDFPQVVVTDHAGNVNCISCHYPHQPELASN
jgi:predicted CXXCH cytochrome family protein